MEMIEEPDEVFRTPRNPTTKQFTLNDFELGPLLGKGAFGAVFLAIHEPTNFCCALKAYNVQRIIHFQMSKQILREIEIMQDLSHPHVLKLYDHFRTDDYVILVLEYCINGDLFAELQKCGSFEETRAITYTYQTAQALLYCHQKQILHRDIKPENIMLGYFMEVKLADFGWSVHSPDLLRATFCGTADYVSPELLMHTEYSEEVDAWSLGVLLYEMLAGYPPFNYESKEDKYRMIKECKYEFPDFFTSNCRKIVSMLLKHGPVRAKVSDVTNDSYVLSMLDHNYMPNI